MSPNAVAQSPDPIDIHVGAQLRLRRVTLGLSQQETAKGLGVSFQQLQKYETGANRISASRLYRLAEILRSHPASFFPAPEADFSTCAPTPAPTARTVKRGVDLMSLVADLSAPAQRVLLTVAEGLRAAALGERAAGSAIAAE